MPSSTDAGEVAIKAEANNGSFYVSVRDTGPGISTADQAKLFHEFQQADNTITRKKGGTGLGLAISKRIRPRLDICVHAAGHRRAPGRGRMSLRPASAVTGRLKSFRLSPVSLSSRLLCE